MAQAESDKSDLKGTTSQQKPQHLDKDQELSSKVQVEVKLAFEASESCESILKSEKEADNEVKKLCDTNCNKSSTSIFHHQQQQQDNSRPNKLSLLNPFRPDLIPPLSVSPCSPTIKSRNSCVGSFVSDSPSPVSSQSPNWSITGSINTTNLCPYSSFNCSTGIVIASPTRQSLVDLEAINMRLSSGQNQLKSLSSSKLCCKENGCSESECHQAVNDWHVVDQEVEHDGEQTVATTSSLLCCSRSHRLQPIQICRQHNSSVDQTTTGAESSQITDNLNSLDDYNNHDNSCSQGKDGFDNSRRPRTSLLNVQQTIPRTFSASVLASGAAGIQRRQSGGNSRCLPATTAAGGTNNSVNSSTAASNSQQRFSFWESLVGSSNLEKHRSKSQYLHQISYLDYNNQNKRSQNSAISDTSNVAAATTTNTTLQRDEFHNQNQNPQQQQENFAQNQQQQQAQFLQLPTFWTQQTRKR